MKICWDNLEGLIYNNKTNKWYSKKGKTKNIYIYKEKCETCNEPFLAKINSKGLYCCCKCIRLSEKTKQNLSIKNKGKTLSEEIKKKMGKSHKGKTFSREHCKNISKTKKGKNNPMYGKYKEHSANWRGGYTSNNIPLYNTYAPQLKWCEKVRRRSIDKNILEVKCFKCNKWFIPKAYNVYNRIQYIKGNTLYYENRFYCSEQCKQSCSIYGKTSKQIMREDAVRAGREPWWELNREVQPELKQMVLERDGNQCVKCGNFNNLCCHHILPVALEPLLSADIDNCITLCVDCHKAVHQQDGCRYGQLRQC